MYVVYLTTYKHHVVLSMLVLSTENQLLISTKLFFRNINLS